MFFLKITRTCRVKKQTKIATAAATHLSALRMLRWKTLEWLWGRSSRGLAVVSVRGVGLFELSKFAELFHQDAMDVSARRNDQPTCEAKRGTSATREEPETEGRGAGRRRGRRTEVERAAVAKE
jgi:hypothetical protein